MPAILWAALILFLSSGAMPNMPKLWWEELISPDKLGHLVVYGILSLTLMYGFQKKNATTYELSEETAILDSIFIQNKNGVISKVNMIWVLSISIIYGILMEIMQYCFFPNRYFEIFDIIANIIGSISAPCVFRKLIFKKS